MNNTMFLKARGGAGADAARKRAKSDAGNSLRSKKVVKLKTGRRFLMI